MELRNTALNCGILRTEDVVEAEPTKRVLRGGLRPLFRDGADGVNDDGPHGSPCGPPG